LYATARDLAEAALRLLEERRGEDRVGLDIEMAAALLAVHVCDWHYIKTLGHSRATDADKRAFAAIYPDWNILREIANGTKHPEPENIDVSSAIRMGGRRLLECAARHEDTLHRSGWSGTISPQPNVRLLQTVSHRHRFPALIAVHKPSTQARRVDEKY
jgi:hypothetical protein